MKDIKDVLGLPVVSIEAGEEIAVVKSLIINSNTKSIVFLIVERKDNRQVLNCIDFKNIEGIGCYAITINSQSLVVDLNELNMGEKIYKNYDEIISTKIISKAGNYIGLSTGFKFDEESGEIISLEYYDENNEEFSANKQDLITLGNKLIIINSDINNKKITASINESNKEKRNFRKNDNTKKDNVLENKKDNISFILEQEMNAVGKILKKDIIDYKGNTLLYKGSEITKDTLDKIKEIDESLVYEIIASV